MFIFKKIENDEEYKDIKKPFNMNNFKVKTMSTLQSVRMKYDRKENKKFSVRILESKTFTPSNLEINKSLKSSKLDYSKILNEGLIEEYESNNKIRRKSERFIELYYKNESCANKNVSFTNKFEKIALKIKERPSKSNYFEC